MSLLLVTKPFAPPWHDSSSGLARSLVHGLIDAGDGPDVRVMVGDIPSGFAGITEERTYGPSADFAPGDALLCEWRCRRRGRANQPHAHRLSAFASTA